MIYEGYESINPNTYDFRGCITRNEKDGPYYKRDVVAALMKSGGVYSEMSTLLGRNRTKVKAFVEANPDMKEIRDDLQEHLLDKVEAGQFNTALMGDGQAQRFLLTTLGKNRGYSTRVEATGADGAAMVFTEVRRRIVDPTKPDSGD